MKVEFSPEQKAEQFDRIANCFYDHNFGNLSKSDMELLMFDIYLKKLMEENRNDDGTINYNKCSDYVISKELGITQQRVRNLKIKKQLVYPEEFDWKEALANLLRHARYDESSRMITMNIPDPNLFIEIQNELEEKGAYIERQLNSKVLKLRAEYFLALIVEIESDESSKQKAIREIKKQFKESCKKDEAFNEREIGASLEKALSITADISTIVANVTSVLSPGNVLATAFAELYTTIRQRRD